MRDSFEFDEDEMAKMLSSYSEKSTEKYAKPIARDAARLAPYDSSNPHASGEPHLKDSLQVIPDEGGHLVGSDNSYAAAVELGSRPHGIPNAFGRGRTVDHPGGPAQPYLRPALYQDRERGE